ncbi:protein DPCD [Lycorma delicatula]|uniref:protein DPCD n=1 Tax=Lycorma delicatula TaxID=130591 RepID=UPI003F514251
MAENEWLKRIKQAEKTAIVQDGKFKVHYKFPNGYEMAEEYNMSSNTLLRRAWRKQTELKKNNEWEVEVGDPEPRYTSLDIAGFKESSDNPYIVKRVTKTNLEWRIRNLPYPLETYSVTTDQNEKCIVVKTSNKKYFKKLQVQELDRVGLVPEQQALDYSHKFNTLIITYKKPQQVLQMESKVYDELKKIETLNDGNFDCKQS